MMRPHRICQVEITRRYDHKHQEVGNGGYTGLSKMASDIARTFFSRLSAGGCVLNQDFLRTLKHTYLATARSFVHTYESVADMNNLTQFDQHQDLATIEIFAAGLDQAFTQYSDLLFGSPMISDWRRIEVALEGTISELTNAFDRAAMGVAA
jgi:glucosyl-3-phosphoglycerate synthase